MTARLRLVFAVLLLASGPSAEAAATLVDRLAAAQAAARLGEGARLAAASEERLRILAIFRLPEKADVDLVAAAEALVRAVPATEIRLERRFETVPALAATVSPAGLAALLDDPSVLRIDLDLGGEGALAQAVPLIGASALHGSGVTGAGSVVAIVDSGYDASHADLADSLDGEACFCSGSGGCCPGGGTSRSGPGSAADDNGHGTHVAGIVTGNGDVAPIGVAPGAKVVAVKVLDASNGFCCTSDVVAALDWIAVQRPDVDAVNLSLGTFARFEGECDSATSFTQALAAAVAALRARGIAVFASSGNEGSATTMTAPACLRHVVSVGAVYDGDVGSQAVLCPPGVVDAATSAEKVTCFTNSNATLDVVAPGAPILGPKLGGGTITYYGTSMASPMVAGCAALIRQAKPSAAVASIETAVRVSPFTGTDVKNGRVFPRLFCPTALAAAGADTSPCVRGPQVACLLGGRFEVKVTWRTAGGSGDAAVMSFGGQRAESDQSAFYWFFDAANFEMGVKMVNACTPPFNRFWVFVSGLTNQGFTVRVRDTQNGNVKVYENTIGNYPQTVGDTDALPCG